MFNVQEPLTLGNEPLSLPHPVAAGYAEVLMSKAFRSYRVPRQRGPGKPRRSDFKSQSIGHVQQSWYDHVYAFA